MTIGSSLREALAPRGGRESQYRGRIVELLELVSLDESGIDRASFSAADIDARAWLISRCAEAGLRVEVDGIGNIVISSDALEHGLDDRAHVWTGSHIDAVPNGGRFDGPLGSLAALECVRQLHEENARLHRPVRAIIFADEEGNYAHLLGSSAISRGFTGAELNRLVGCGRNPAVRT